MLAVSDWIASRKNFAFTWFPDCSGSFLRSAEALFFSSSLFNRFCKKISSQTASKKEDEDHFKLSRKTNSYVRSFKCSQKHHKNTKEILLTFEKQQVDDFSLVAAVGGAKIFWWVLGFWNIPLCFCRPPLEKNENRRREWRTTPKVEIQLGIFIVVISRDFTGFKNYTLYRNNHHVRKACDEKSLAKLPLVIWTLTQKSFCKVFVFHKSDCLAFVKVMYI